MASFDSAMGASCWTLPVTMGASLGFSDKSRPPPAAPGAWERDTVAPDAYAADPAIAGALARALTPARVGKLAANGYLVIEDALPPALARQFAAEVASIADAGGGGGGEGGSSSAGGGGVDAEYGGTLRQTPQTGLVRGDYVAWHRFV